MANFPRNVTALEPGQAAAENTREGPGSPFCAPRWPRDGVGRPRDPQKETARRPKRMKKPTSARESS